MPFDGSAELAEVGLGMRLRAGPIRDWSVHWDSVPVGTHWIQIQTGLSILGFSYSISFFLYIGIRCNAPTARYVASDAPDC